MARTQDDIDALQAAIDTGARAVTYSDGSQVEYRTLAEMRSILKEMKTEVSGAKPVRAFRGSVRSGY
jgi:hypothetical protein